jgi:hypothetical protein
MKVDPLAIIFMIIFRGDSSLPIVLNLEEMKRFLAAAVHPKYHAAFSVAYGA